VNKTADGAVGGQKSRAERIILRRLFRNSATLLMGNVGASLLGLVSLALTARALGVEQFGVLVLISTYVLVMDRLVNCQSWQALIRYGALALEARRDADFKSLLKFGFMLDGATAILGTILAIGIAYVVGRWQGWDDQYLLMTFAYSATILFHISGTPAAILRLFDRFRRVALHHVIAAAIKLLAVAVVFALNGGLWAFLIAWIASDMLGHLVLLYFAKAELARRQIVSISKSRARSAPSNFPGLWSFLWTTNLHSSVKLGLREVDILVVGAVLGAPGVGLYKVVKTVGATLGKLTDPLYQAVYPDIARAVGVGDLRSVSSLVFSPMRWVALAGISGLLGFAVVGEPLIGAVFGPDYRATFHPALVFLVGTFFAMLTFGFHPAMLAFGKAQLSLSILIFSTIVYLLLLYGLTVAVGLVGSAVAYVFFYLTWSAIQLFFINRYLGGERIEQHPIQ
jgi:O-antigen/teichoic acid export membrane protein